MNSYATLDDLAARVPWQDLAEAGAPDTAALDGTLLRQYWESGDGTDDNPRAVPDDAEGVMRADFERALQRLTRVLDDAGATVDGYLLGRYRIPEDASDPIARIARARTLDVAVYRLLGGATDKAAGGAAENPHHRVYREALAWLGAVAGGTIELVPPPPDTAAAGDVRFDSGTTFFGDIQELGL